MAHAYALPRASDEQKDAIRCLVDKNVIIDSVAGSGKTTTVLYIAKIFARKNILLLTYNAKLKIETRERVDALKIPNLEVHSYHSFAVKNIGPDCCTDAGIIKWINSTKEPIAHNYDMIVIDEAQDMTLLYYKLCSRLINPRTQVCILGDKFQSIYAFNGADERFITFAHLIFGGAPFPYVKTLLSTSYRITNQIAAFMNRVILRYDRLRAVKDGPRVRYVFSKYESGAYLEVKRQLEAFPATDIFILAASVRPSQQSPLRKLANRLSADGIPIYIPSDDNRKLDEEVLVGKLVFSSFHQAKGLERKCVIVFGFDMSYYEYYNKNARKELCPNELYVALTRASIQLSVIHTNGKGYLPFIDRDLIPLYCDVAGELDKVVAAGDIEHIKVAATELIRHLPSDVLNRCYNMIKVTQIKPPGITIDIPTKTLQKSPFGDDLYEEVSDITGTAIPAYYQFQSTGEMRIHEKLCEIGDAPALSTEPSQLLMLANKYNSHVSGLIYKINQVQKYDWLTIENLDASAFRLSESMSAKARYEIGITLHMLGRVITGYIDAIDGGTLWEIKCTRDIQPEHVLQTAIYAFMYETLTGHHLEYKINNILTGEIVSLECSYETLREILTIILHHKYHSSELVSDAEFLQRVGGGVVPDKPPCVICTMANPITATEIMAVKKVKTRRVATTRHIRKK